MREKLVCVCVRALMSVCVRAYECVCACVNVKLFFVSV